MGNDEHVDVVDVTYQNPHASMPLTVPTAVITNTSDEVILGNMATNAARYRSGWLNRQPERAGVAIIVGGGPSVQDHLGEIATAKQKGATIFALNAASTWLRAYGIPVDYQVILDARPETALLVDPSADAHLIASQCDPATFARCTDPILWHSTHGNHAPEFPGYEHDYTMIGGSITVGNAALVIAFCLGFRRIDCYGYDSSDRGADHHGYPQTQTADEQARVITRFRGKEYRSAVAMKLQAQYFMQRAAALKAAGAQIRVIGDGLLPDLYNAGPMDELEKYEQIWQEPAYRAHSPGERIAKDFVNWTGCNSVDTVVDLGCGTGRGGAAIHKLTGAQIVTVDLAGNALDGGTQPDYQMDLAAIDCQMGTIGYCTDVLEHIPPDRIDATLKGIFASAPRIFLQISTVPDDMGALIGQHLHLTVQPFEWWMAKMLSFPTHTLRQYDDRGDTCLFYLVRN